MPFIPDSPTTQSSQQIQPINSRFIPEKTTKTWKEKLSDVGKTIADIPKGVIKGAGSTLSNIEKLGTKGLETLTGIKSPTPRMQQVLGETLKPKTTGEKIGFTAEQIGEFFIPAGTTAKAVKASEKAARYLPKAIQGATKLAARSGITAGEAYGISKLQGKSDEEANFAAIVSGAIPILGAGASKLLKGTSTRIEQSLLRPTTQDIKNGFKTENIFKYNLAGNLETTSKKLNDKFNILTKELAKVTRDNPVNINLNEALDEVASEMQKIKYKTFGANTRVQNAVNFLKDEIAQITDDGIVTLPEAMQIKRSVGKLGAWQYGVRDPDATALEAVANNFYTKLRRTTQSAVPGLERIEKQLSELIPIETAIIRRIPVAERQNIISLTDLVSIAPAFADPSNMWLYALNKLSKSGTLARGMRGLSDLLEGTGIKRPIRTTIMGSENLQ